LTARSRLRKGVSSLGAFAAAALPVIAAMPLCALASDTLFSPDGFRIAQFMSAVPEAAPGAATVSTPRVKAMADAGEAVLIDVLPAPRRPKGLPATSLWLPPERRDIPGSVWLPNVGYGRLSDELDRYFRTNLQRFSDGRRDKEIIIYCRAECWMSWNAAKRAAAYGYTRVYWYPEGTTGWEAAGLPLKRNESVPLEPAD
jgi:PQQ-dependent catabolism-associated CXXCW motif protein